MTTGWNETRGTRLMDWTPPHLSDRHTLSHYCIMKPSDWMGLSSFKETTTLRLLRHFNANLDFLPVLFLGIEGWPFFFNDTDWQHTSIFLDCWVNPHVVKHGPWKFIYPLVNIQKTMENHHFLWVNPLFLWSFSIAMYSTIHADSLGKSM